MFAFIQSNETQTLFDAQAKLVVNSREFRFLSAVADKREECTRCEVSVTDGRQRTWELVVILRGHRHDCDTWIRRTIRRVVADWLLENQYLPRLTSWDNPVEIEWPPPQIYRGPV